MPGPIPHPSTRDLRSSFEFGPSALRAGRTGVGQIATTHLGIAGALSFTEYREGLEVAGFTDISITPTHAVADGMHSAIVHAVKPVAADARAATESADACCGVNACCTSAETSADPALTVTEAKSASGCGCQG